MKIDMDSVLRSVVESMLPRFSDHKLGLWIPLDLHYSDLGFDKDGNTRIRKPMDIRLYPNLLFVRPSNYTKVFYWMADSKAKGLDISPKYQEYVWDLKCDHDSCWSDFDYLKKLEYDAHKKLRTRAKEKYCHVHVYSSFGPCGDPSYVELTTFERVHPQADRFSTEGRLHRIAFKKIHRSKVVCFQSPDTRYVSDSGLLIEGSEDYHNYRLQIERAGKRQAEILT